MKELTIVVLIFCFVSCNKKTKYSNYTAQLNSNLNAEKCFALDSIRFCSDKSDAFCSNLPLYVYYLNSKDGNFSNGYSSVLSPDFQPSFDNFSWQSFVALNWASNSSGMPIGSSITDYPDSLRVWERYRDASVVFNTASEHLKGLKAKHPDVKIVSEIAKVSSVVEISDFLEVDSNPLIDSNLNFVVYEVKMNSIEEQFIINNNLNTKEGIYNYYKSKGKIELPMNTETIPGATEVKASWRILDETEGDDLSKYYTQNAKISVSSEQSTSGEAFSFDCTIGLIGLHILRKTQKFENWIWSTFEHIDNVPNDVQQAQTDRETNWSFYNPECLNCPVNKPPTHVEGDTLDSGKVVYRWNTKAPYASLYAESIPGEAGNQNIFGTQVTRTFPIYFCTEQLNAIWQSKLSAVGSVFANYKLIGSQWMVPLDAPPFSKINAPKYLGNTTSETYMQDSSSCISCHNFAGVKYDSINISTDFSFTFLYAQ